MVPWLAMFLISLAINVVAYLLTPKPKTPRPEAAKQSDVPTADASRPIPVVFGTVRVSAVNVLFYGDQTMNQYQVKA